jgi:hypothetical protein
MNTRQTSRRRWSSVARRHRAGQRAARRSRGRAGSLATGHARQVPCAWPVDLPQGARGIPRCPVQPSFAGAEGAAAGPSQHQTCRLRPGDGSRLRRKSRPLVVVRPSCYCPPFGAPGAFRSGTGGQVARYSCARRYKPEGILDIASIRQLPARKSSRKRAKICFVVISAWTITGMVQLCQSHQFSRWPQR